MEAKELMIGDWVGYYSKDRIKGNPYLLQIHEIRNKSITLVSNSCLYQVADLNELSPIPLTPEILEKNGFENIPYAGIDCNEIWLLHDIAYYGKSFPLYTDDIMLRYSISEQCWFIFFNIGDMHSDFRTITNICYVHELQHALKLCGVEKEIVL